MKETYDLNHIAPKVSFLCKK